jgi:hypothetical protein
VIFTVSLSGPRTVVDLLRSNHHRANVGIKAFRDGRFARRYPTFAGGGACRNGLIQSVAFTGTDGRWLSLSMNGLHSQRGQSCLSCLSQW